VDLLSQKQKEEKIYKIVKIIRIKHVKISNSNNLFLSLTVF